MANKIAAAIFGVLLIVAAGMSLMKPAEIAPLIKFNMKSDLVIGERIPDYYHAECSFQDYGEGQPYEDCIIRDVDGSSYISISSTSRVIDGVSYDGRGTLAGDLILSWGPPDTINQDYGFITMYWGNKTAWAFAKAFSPNTKISWVDLYSDANYGKRFSKWRGFGASNLESK